MPAIFGKMNRISRCGMLYRGEKLQDLDINACQHSFVLAICHHPGMSQEQIARHLCLNKSTVARALTQQESTGYVIRTPDTEDKRVLLVYPTEKMENVFPRVREVTREWNRSLMEGISEEETEIFLSVLTRITERAKELTGNAADKGGAG